MLGYRGIIHRSSSVAARRAWWQRATPVQRGRSGYTVQHSTNNTAHVQVRSIAHACGVLCCHSSHPRFTTSVAWSATSNSMQLASSLGSGGWVSTSRDRVGTSCARPSWLDSQARGGRPSRRRERVALRQCIYVPAECFPLSLSPLACQRQLKQLNK